MIALSQPHVVSIPEVPLPPISPLPNASESPQQILIVVKARPETLMRLYYLRHNFEYYNPITSYFLSVFGFMAIDELK